jgi:type I restriction enzyme S subunit
MLVSIGDLVGEVTSGDWGKGEPEPNLVECTVIRATDFESLAHGDVSEAPHRFVRSASAKTRQVAAGDLLVEMSGGSEAQPTGRSVLVGDDVAAMKPPVVFSNFVKRLRLRSAVDSQYFALVWSYLYRNGKTRPYEKRTTGIRNFRLDDFLGSETMPLPQIDEQRRIARIVSTIEASARASLQCLSARGTLRSSLSEHLLQEARAGSVEVRFSEVVRIVSGQVDPREEPFAALPHIAPDSIEANSGRLLSVSTAGELGLISGKYEFEAGDVIYCKIRPYLNKAVIAPFHGTCSADMYVLRSQDKRLLQSFLFYLLLDSYFLVQATSHQGRTGIPKINREQLNSTALFLPPLDVQARIIRTLSAADSSVEANLSTVDCLRTVGHSAMGVLFDGAAAA